MRKLLTCTTALSVALSSVPVLPAYAQTMTEDGSVIGPDGAVLCSAADGAACDLDAITKSLAAAAEQAAAEAAAAAEAEAQAAAAAEAEAQAAAAAEAEAAAKAAEAEAAAQAAADEAAAAAAKAAEEEAAAAAQAAEQAAADEAAKAAADAEAAAAEAVAAQAAAEEEAAKAAAEAEAAQAAAAEEAASAEAAAVAAAEEAAKAEAEAAAQAATEGTEEPAAEAAASEEPAAVEPSEEAPAVVAEDPAAEPADGSETAAGPDEAAPEEVAPEEAAPVEVTEGEATEGQAAEGETAAEATDPAADPATDPAADPAAELATAPEAPVETAPVDEPVVNEEATVALDSILAAPTVTDELIDENAPAPAEGEAATEAPAETAETAAPAVPEAAAAFLSTSDSTAASEGGEATTETAPAVDPVAVVSEVISAENTRTSDQEFAAAPVAVSKGKKSGLSDLEKVGLLALGAVVVGTIINQGKKDAKTVVSNSGDRVVVQNPDGSYSVYKDDDAVLRRPGVETKTETYRDGSTRTIVQRADGTEVVTVRDASGRVLRRATYDRNGQEIILIDDLYPEERIDITKLPKPKPGRVTISTSDSDAGLKAELAALEAADLGRKFSLRQIREIPQVRALAATIEVDNITFNTGSAAIGSSEARNLADIGRLIQDLLEANPREVFLIEGHTDAVGSAASNLALSDRRAESMALALTEYFDIPPENLVVQGYGESELKIDSNADERANRRVVVRLITPLMRTAELR